MSIYIHAYIYIFIYIYIYEYINIHTYIYMHISHPIRARSLNSLGSMAAVSVYIYEYT